MFIENILKQHFYKVFLGSNPRNPVHAASGYNFRACFPYKLARALRKPALEPKPFNKGN